MSFRLISSNFAREFLEICHILIVEKHKILPKKTPPLRTVRFFLKLCVDGFEVFVEREVFVEHFFTVDNDNAVADGVHEFLVVRS